MSLSQFDAAPLIAATATKEMSTSGATKPVGLLAAECQGSLLASFARGCCLTTPLFPAR